MLLQIKRQSAETTNAAAVDFIKVKIKTVKLVAAVKNRRIPKKPVPSWEYSISPKIETAAGIRRLKKRHKPQETRHDERRETKTIALLYGKLYCPFIFEIETIRGR